jgi:hypothetical protein
MIYIDASGAGFIHHIQRENHWEPKLSKLGSKQQSAAQILPVANLDDSFQGFVQQNSGGDLLVLSVGREANNAGGVDYVGLGEVLGGSASNFHSCPRIIGDGDVMAGQFLEDNGLANIGLADQGDASFAILL